jgi:hypothetical protein
VTEAGKQFGEWVANRPLVVRDVAAGVRVHETLAHH